MERYFRLYEDEKKAIDHYCSNIELAESFYPSLSIFEVALRNALSRELETMTGREDWYVIFPNTPGLTNLNRYITQAQKQITSRKENVTPAKVIAELNPLIKEKIIYIWRPVPILIFGLQSFFQGFLIFRKSQQISLTNGFRMYPCCGDATFNARHVT